MNASAAAAEAVCKLVQKEQEKVRTEARNFPAVVAWEQRLPRRHDTRGPLKSKSRQERSLQLEYAAILQRKKYFRHFLRQLRSDRRVQSARQHKEYRNGKKTCTDNIGGVRIRVWLGATLERRY